MTSREKYPAVWTSEQDALLVEQHQKGATFSQIRDALIAAGFAWRSRQSIAGRVSRLRKKLGPSVILRRTTSSTASGRPRQQPFTPAPSPSPSATRSPPSARRRAPPGFISEIDTQRKGVTLVEIESRECRFPLGDRTRKVRLGCMTHELQLFCGAETKAGRVFCDYHKQRCKRSESSEKESE